MTRLLAVIVLVGCVPPASIKCEDTFCPVGKACVTDRCVEPADVTACNGLADGDVCTSAAGLPGVCDRGVCSIVLCGDGIVETDEACDDGNQASGDGCRADCGKVERCDDGSLDAAEACDDGGNDNPNDGCDHCRAVNWHPRTLIGDLRRATEMELAGPSGIAFLGDSVLVADTGNARILRITADGYGESAAGNGAPGFVTNLASYGDGGPATAARLRLPASVAVDGAGRYYVADPLTHTIRRVDTDGTIATIAGILRTTGGNNGDGLPATATLLDSPGAVAIDNAGRVILAERGRIRRIELDGTIATIAGDGTLAFRDGMVSQVFTPTSMAVAADGSIYFADGFNGRVRAIAPDLTVSTITGDGTPGFYPTAIALDASGHLYIADSASHQIVRLDGSTRAPVVNMAGIAGDTGDGGSALAARIDRPTGLAFDAAGRMVIADGAMARVRVVDNGVISTIAGTGAVGSWFPGRAANTLKLVAPRRTTALESDAQGRVVIATLDRLWRRELDGTITPLAGSGRGGNSTDGVGTAATFRGIYDLALDGSGALIVADTYANAIRKIDPSGNVTTIAGTLNAMPGYGGDNGPATSASLNGPRGVAIASDGAILISDTGNHRIRRVASGTITTLAGLGTAGLVEGTVATARFDQPWELAVDSTGRIVVADSQNHRIRMISGTTVSTVAGTTQGFVDNVAATSAKLDTPIGVTVDAMDRVIVSDQTNDRVRRFAIGGTIETVAGYLKGGSYTRDGVIATQTNLTTPVQTVVLGSELVIADSANDAVRRVDGTGIITTIAGRVDPDNTGPIATARLAHPQSFVIAGANMFFAGGLSGTVEAVFGGRLEVVGGRHPEMNNDDPMLARYQSRDLREIGGVAYDSTGPALYVTNTETSTLRKIAAIDTASPFTWSIATVPVQLSLPRGLLFDGGKLFIADTGNHAIRVLDGNSLIDIVNANHRFGFSGDGGPALDAQLFEPTAVARCGADLVIADTGNHRVRRVSQGTITTALTLPDKPRGLACDTRGDLFVTSQTLVRVLTPSGVVATIYQAPATSCLTGIAVVDEATVRVTDACTGQLLELSRD